MESYGIKHEHLNDLDENGIHCCIATLSGLLNISQQSEKNDKEINPANFHRWNYEQALIAAIESLQEKIQTMSEK